MQTMPAMSAAARDKLLAASAEANDEGSSPAKGAAQASKTSGSRASLQHVAGGGASESPASPKGEPKADAAAKEERPRTSRSETVKGGLATIASVRWSLCVCDSDSVFEKANNPAQAQKKASPALAQRRDPRQLAGSAGNKGELMLKMQELIQSHEETLALLAKSSGAAIGTPTGGTPTGSLRRGKGLLAAGFTDAAPRLSTRASFLNVTAENSAADLEKKVRAQRRRLGLALSLRDLPEPGAICYHLVSHC